MKQFTLAVGLTTTGLMLGLASLPSFAATPQAGNSVITNTTSTSSHTFVHDTQVNINNYLTKVLGLATWEGPGAENPFTDRQVYSGSFNLPAGSQEVQHAYNDAVAAVQSTLDSTGGRGQVQIGSDVQTTSSSSSNTVETGRTTTVTATTETTIGPGTVIIGDRDSGGTIFNVVAGGTNININTDTQTDINTTTTTTTITDTTYTVSGTLYSSPIVLNLSGDGKLGASDGHWLPHPKSFYNKHRVLFDFYGNGFPVAMEWVGSNDGLLVHPKSDGSVDGTCLFGNANGYANGYEQLAALDLNMDGHVSGKELAGLSVWQDKNTNGKCEAGELQSVAQLGITDLNLKHSQYKSSFTMKGKTQAMYDWWPTMFELKKNKQPV
ncbi:hypothetical protein JST97_21805 [bacterium]|nr:hypothetical protein [bacterium]